MTDCFAGLVEPAQHWDARLPDVREKVVKNTKNYLNPILLL